MELKPCSICGGKAEFVFIKPLTLCDCYEEPTGVELLFNVKCKKCGRQIESYSICIDFHSDGRIEEINLDAFNKAADKWNKDNTPTVDWTKVKVDTPIYVSTIGNIWHPRYFAKFKDEKVYAWSDGKTSFTVECNEVTSWEYAKLANEE